MPEYIEREALKEHMKGLPTWTMVAKADGVYEKVTNYPEGMFNCDDVIISIQNIPSADVVEVVHGYWEFNRGQAYGEPLYFCSVCTDGGSEWGKDKYCPSCGAKMDGERRTDNG